MYANLLKPILDFILAFILFILLLPLLFGITVILLIHLKDNPFFTQLRVGKNAQIFTVIKFKTLKALNMEILEEAIRYGFENK